MRLAGEGHGPFPAGRCIAGASIVVGDRRPLVRDRVAENAGIAAGARPSRHSPPLGSEKAMRGSDGPFRLAMGVKASQPEPAPEKMPGSDADAGESPEPSGR